MSEYDVCVITTIHGDFDNRIYHRQINSLIDAGFRVCVVAPWDFSKRTRSDYGFVSTLPYPAKRSARIAHGWRTFKAARKVNAKAYIFHDPDFLPWALLLRKRTRKPVVYDCHEHLPEEILHGKEWIPDVIRRPLASGFRKFENFAVRSLGEAIQANPGKIVDRFKAQGARVVLVRNYSKFNVPADFVNDRAVLYTGEVTPDYGVYNLLGIAREMKRRGLAMPMRIVDRFWGDEELRAKVKNQIAEEQLPIEILAPVTAERMPEILAKGCIGLSPIEDLPSKASNLPTKVFEYFAFGLVTLASDVGQHRWVLQDGYLGFLFEPHDYVAWVDAIEKLMNDPALFAEYQRRGRQAISDTYNWEAEERALVDYVGDLIGHPGGADSRIAA